MADHSHPLNKQDQRNWKKAREQIINDPTKEVEFIKAGRWLKKRDWHKWHISH